MKVSQLSRTYLVNVLAFHEAHPEWIKPCKTHGDFREHFRFGISFKKELSQPMQFIKGSFVE